MARRESPKKSNMTSTRERENEPCDPGVVHDDIAAVMDYDSNLHDSTEYGKAKLTSAIAAPMLAKSPQQK
jgi:hypothetical protein